MGVQMCLTLEHLAIINSCDGKKLYLPNSVFVTNSSIIITDGGNNRICIIEGDKTYSIGSFGIGKYKFKEPVYSILNKTEVFVCDWHNHRIVQYENKIFKNQIGIFGNKSNRPFKIIIQFLKNLRQNGSFIEKHFDSKINLPSKISKKNEIYNILYGLWFYVINFRIFIQNFHKKIYINKPNGCIVLENKLVFTQKNNKCISVYDLNKKVIIQEVNNNFGRLGQITYFNEKIYVCDETNNFLYVFSKDLKIINKKTITNYNIFSLSVNEKYIVTCGETSFSIFNHNFKLLFQKTGEGEYHGVALDKNILYICNRLKNQIEKYEIMKDQI